VTKPKQERNMNDVRKARTQPDCNARRTEAENPIDPESPWPVIDSCGHGYQDWRGRDSALAGTPESVCYIIDGNPG
jgi:hypothetical protein